MAIDDNTSYELTGYQVKDLAQKIRGKADDDVFVGAGTSVAGSRGLVPAPAAGDQDKVLKGDGTWGAIDPIVNDGTLTIIQNGTTVGTFTANQSTNTTVNLAGGIYADDPTSPANPDGWITPSDIDWSTFTYSTSEQRVGTWINGKPIYKKTIDFGSLPNNSTKNVAHGISNLGDVIDIRGTAKTSWGTYQLPLVFSGSDVNYITNVSVNATNISMSNSADRSGFTAYVTLYYTKTTD